jgi:hypothetical protein
MPEHSVALSSWLKEHDISGQLIKRYHASKWLEPLGRGAYQRKGSPAPWMGALYALQTQADHDGNPGTVLPCR